MFDRLLARLSDRGQHRLLIAEIVIGVLFSAAAFYTALDLTSSSLIATALLPLGAGIALHRVAPFKALAISVVPLIMLLLLGFSGGTPNGAYWLPVYVALFGTVAYGSDAVRWVGRSAALGLTAIFVAGGIYVSSYGLGAAGFVVLLAPAIAVVAGELVVAASRRRALGEVVETVSTERDAALTRADLEAERSRVARDVHDIVAHSLTVVIAQADGARYATAERDAQAAEAFETIARSARDALADVRVLLTELRHTQESGPQPGLADLDGLLAAMRDSGLVLETRQFGDRGRLTEARQLALYRITQEALTNALRHGDGTATLELEWGQSAVDLVVTNPARSDSPAPSGVGAGHGIDGMRERAALAGGELSIHHGGVVRLRARLPLEPAPSEAHPDDGELGGSPVLALEAGSRA
ncbi:histidine kinase [Microcella daejeonensis]|uniref:histidine kinase n=1 Tax=Microcella daejeonensis TaxID=2994971 RepID=A0A9E8MLR9_9MICO|nr:histidine kinase [Microcella daejeonensis]WAB81076.1 histidine kinase [Microcella daejeonensis]